MSKLSPTFDPKETPDYVMRHEWVRHLWYGIHSAEQRSWYSPGGYSYNEMREKQQEREGKNKNYKYESFQPRTTSESIDTSHDFCLLFRIARFSVQKRMIGVCVRERQAEKPRIRIQALDRQKGPCNGGGEVRGRWWGRGKE